MSSGELLLALDVGTQSVRAALFDADGNLRALARRELREPDVPQPGWAEQDPEYFFAQVCAATRELLERHTAAEIGAVALTGQRATLVFVDRNGAPLRPAILWSDQRSTRNLAPPRGLAGAAIALIGAGAIVAHMRAQAEVNWVATHQPDVWAASHKVLLLTSYLNYRLVGEFVDASASQVGYLPFDFRRQRWHRRGNWRWGALAGLRREQLAELHAPGTQLGALTADTAAATGLQSGTPVYAAAADKACEVLGTGCLSSSQACLSFGTAATVNVPNSRYVEADRFAPAYPAAVPGSYTTEIQINRGFWLVSWFMREFGHSERGRARDAGVAPEALLDELLSASPPGALGLVTQPFWTPGIRDPGPEARGAMIGYTDGHTRAHVYRSLIEGLGYALRDGLEKIERRGRLRVSSLRVAGGGARSDAVMQITADLFGLPASRSRVGEASALGAAVCAAVGRGDYEDFPSAVRGMCHTGGEFEPDPGVAALYERLFRDVYLPMYRRLQPLYGAVREITGYPE